MYFQEICWCEEEIEILRTQALLYNLAAGGDRQTLVGWWYGVNGLKSKLIETLRRRDIFSEAYPECSRCLFEILVGEI